MKQNNERIASIQSDNWLNGRWSETISGLWILMIKNICNKKALKYAQCQNRKNEKKIVTQ